VEVKSILISQPHPGNARTAYEILAEKYDLKLDYIPFIQVDPVPGKDLRKKRLNILEHTAIIFTSRNSIDHFFRVVEELKVELPTTMKYFCVNEGISLYIQKYTVLRKRKMFFGPGQEPEFLELLKKHKKEKYLMPCSHIRKDTIPDFMVENGIDFSCSVMFKTVNADLSHLADVYYDIIAFFSPAGIKSLLDNFPDFEQNKTRIAGWGKTTNSAIEKAGLQNNIPAPVNGVASMVGALEQYIAKTNI
jgi:uroporphyrinogen-III synthase